VDTSLFFIIFVPQNKKMPAITIREISYKKWDALEISNSEIKILVIPKVGRIMHYGFLDGPNIFYENDQLKGTQFKTGEYYKEKNLKQAPNIGGNRVLPCSEEYFDTLTGSRHIPDPFINASAFSFLILKNGILLTSPISELLGIQIKRTITISETGTQVDIRQEMVKITAAKNKNLEEIPLTLWSLSKIKTPNTSYLPIPKKSCFKNGFLIPVWPDAKNNAAQNISVENNILAIKSSKNIPQKVGSDSKGWIASFLAKTLFVEKYNFENDKKEVYPDGGTSCTIFGNNLFSELECLSPEKKLKIGEIIQYDLEWNLQKIQNENTLKTILQSL